MSQQLTAEPTPMVGNDPAFRMDAYYYGFDATKVLAVDLILSAVACAGKSFHYTCDWLDPCEPYHDQLRGKNPVECIQNAAKDAAALIETQSEQLAAKDARIAELELAHRRYEYLRTLSPQQFSALWSRCLTMDRKFDEEVDMDRMRSGISRAALKEKGE